MFCIVLYCFVIRSHTVRTGVKQVLIIEKECQPRYQAFECLGSIRISSDSFIIYYKLI